MVYRLSFGASRMQAFDSSNRRRKGTVQRLACDKNHCTDGTMRSFLSSTILSASLRHVARTPCISHKTMQNVVAQHIAGMAAASERNYACKARFERAREYIRSFLSHGVQRRRHVQELSDLKTAHVVLTPPRTPHAVENSSVSDGNIVHEARQRRGADDRRFDEETAAATMCEASTMHPPPAVIRSFREAVKHNTSAVEIKRTAAMQNEANERLRQHHDDTVRRGLLSITTVDHRTTVVRVSLSDLDLDLDKSSISKKTLPKMLSRRLNTLLTPEQRSPGCVIIVSESDTDRVIAIWMPGALCSCHRVAREHARMRHYVSGGWAKGCAAEPVTSPERLAVLWNNMLRLRAYGLNEFCTFVRVEPCGTSYRLIYRNRYGRLVGFQMGSWIDRAQLSRADLLRESEYAIYDAELHEAYRYGVTAAMEFQGEMSTADIRSRVSKLNLGLVASNFLDSRMR